MKKYIMVLVFIFSAAACFADWTGPGGTGQEKKNVSDNPGASYVPSVALDSLGNPHVVWFDESEGAGEIYYLYWNGFEWVDYDGAGRESINISNNPTTSKYPKIQIDVNDYPHIVWEDGASGNREIYYLKWDGAGWVDEDGSGRESINVSDTVLKSCHPDFKLDGSGTPHIAWHEGEEKAEDGDLADIYYQKWGGSGWTGGGGSAGPEKVYDSAYASLWVSLDVDPSGKPHLAWSDGQEDNREIYYLYHDGASWVDSNGSGSGDINISNTADYSSWPRIDVDGSGVPHIVWEDTSDNDYLNIFYLKLSGGTWVDADGVGRESINVSKSYHYSFVSTIRVDPSGTPHIIWTEGAVETSDIYCVKWNGSSWADETGSGTAYRNVSNDYFNSEWASFTLDGYGYPHIVWSNGPLYKAHDIHYLKWMPEGTPTATKTININATITPTPTISATFTRTGTSTPSPTITPGIPAPPHAPAHCWADVDLHGYESMLVERGEEPDLAVDQAGNPHITWQSGGRVYYLKWNGAEWVDADGAGRESAAVAETIFNCENPSLEIDGSGLPHIAFTGGIGGWEHVYYLKWGGFSWVDADGTGQESVSIPFSNGGMADDVSLRLDGSGAPRVAWSDYPEDMTHTARAIFYMQWNGMEWVDADGAGHESSMVWNNNYDSTAPSLGLDASGRPAVAWQEETAAADRVYYLKYSGGSWAPAGGSAEIITNAAASYGRNPCLETDSLGNPHVSFESGPDSVNEPCYLKFDGSYWVDYDGAGQESMNLPHGKDVFGTTLALGPADEPHISRASPDGVFYSYLQAGAWVDADGSGNESEKVITIPGTEFETVMEADSTGRAFIAWSDYVNGEKFVHLLANICREATLTVTGTPTVTLSPAITFTRTISPTVTFTLTISPTYTETLTPTIFPSFTITPTPFPKGFFGVYPNPFNPRKARGGTLKFLNVSPGSRVFIYTIAGEFIKRAREKSRTAEWDGKNRYGDYVSPGIYYYIYRTGNNVVERKGKIFVTGR